MARRESRRTQYESSTYREILRRLAASLVQLRGTRGWTQEQAAERCEMAVAYYQALEHGRKNVTATTLARLSSGFSVDVRRLFGP